MYLGTALHKCRSLASSACRSWLPASSPYAVNLYDSTVQFSPQIQDFLFHYHPPAEKNVYATQSHIMSPFDNAGRIHKQPLLVSGFLTWRKFTKMKIRYRTPYSLRLVWQASVSDTMSVFSSKSNFPSTTAFYYSASYA